MTLVPLKGLQDHSSYSQYSQKDYWTWILPTEYVKDYSKIPKEPLWSTLDGSLVCRIVRTTSYRPAV